MVSTVQYLPFLAALTLMRSLLGSAEQVNLHRTTRLYNLPSGVQSQSCKTNAPHGKHGLSTVTDCSRHRDGR